MSHPLPRRAPILAWVAVSLALGPALRAQPVAPSPELTITVRPLVGGAIGAGLPLEVAIRLEAPEDATAPILLAPAAGPWSEAISVDLLGSAGGEPVVKARAAGAPASPHASLDAEQVALGLFLFPAVAMTQVATGDYAVRARLEITDGTGWRGAVQSRPVAVRIEALSGLPPREVQGVLARATEALVTGTPEAAAVVLDAGLARHPDDRDLLVVRALLSLEAGDLSSARICLERARELELRAGALHPSAGLEEVRLRLAAARGAPPATPSALTRLPVLLPAAVLARLPEAPPPATPATSPAPGATPVSGPAPAPTPDRVPGDPASGAPAASLPPASPSGPGFPGAVVPARELGEAMILADPAGQWAGAATAGSEYDPRSNPAARMTGPPDVPMVGNSSAAWCHGSAAKGREWVELAFPLARPAAGVRVRQSNAPGAIVQVEALEPDGTAHLWWEGRDPFVPPPVRDIAWFAVQVPPTSYPVARIRLTLDLASGPGWKQIDAVQLVAAPGR